MYRRYQSKNTEGPRITIVRCKGARIGADVANEGNKFEQWVRNSTGPMPMFDPHQEKETCQREIKEVLGQA